MYAIAIFKAGDMNPCLCINVEPEVREHIQSCFSEKINWDEKETVVVDGPEGDVNIQLVIDEAEEHLDLSDINFRKTLGSPDSHLYIALNDIDEHDLTFVSDEKETEFRSLTNAILNEVQNHWDEHPAFIDTQGIHPK